MNIANGTVAAPQINVGKALYIGENQLLKFEKLLPTGLWKPTERKINIAKQKRNFCYRSFFYETDSCSLYSQMLLDYRLVQER